MRFVPDPIPTGMLDVQLRSYLKSLHVARVRADAWDEAARAAATGPLAESLRAELAAADAEIASLSETLRTVRAIASGEASPLALGASAAPASAPSARPSAAADAGRILDMVEETLRSSRSGRMTAADLVSALRGGGTSLHEAELSRLLREAADRFLSVPGWGYRMRRPGDRSRAEIRAEARSAAQAQEGGGVADPPAAASDGSDDAGEGAASGKAAAPAPGESARADGATLPQGFRPPPGVVKPLPHLRGALQDEARRTLTGLGTILAKAEGATDA